LGMNMQARSGSPILVDSQANTLDMIGTSNAINAGSILFCVAQ